MTWPNSSGFFIEVPIVFKSHDLAGVEPISSVNRRPPIEPILYEERPLNAPNLRRLNRVGRLRPDVQPAPQVMSLPGPGGPKGRR